MLHAKRLSIVLPGKGQTTFRTIFPERFLEFFPLFSHGGTGDTESTEGRGKRRPHAEAQRRREMRN
jgi:hypothetical protein